MTSTKQLIVNADDFGLSPGINRGIIAAHRNGIVTSASLMVRWPAAADAVAQASANPRLGLGLHLDLGEWALRHGTWVPIYEVVPLKDSAALAEEVDRQLAAFRQLTGANPTHIDSHQHVHRAEPVRSVVCTVARAMSIPVRHFTPDLHYCSDFYGQTNTGAPLHEAISVAGLLAALSRLAAGITELSCHPGDEPDTDSAYGTQRAVELKTLCDRRVHDAIQDGEIKLRSFRPHGPGNWDSACP
jgi:predicted glycoside hydrolase/deacetylase ChbG (UPF0249 family)